MIETAVVPASLDRYPGLAAQPAVTQLLTFQYFPAGASRIDMLDSLTVFLTDRCSARYTYVGKTKIDVFHRLFLYSMTSLCCSYYSAPARQTADLLAAAGRPVHCFLSTHRLQRSPLGPLNRSLADGAAALADLLGPAMLARLTGRNPTQQDREVGDTAEGKVDMLYGSKKKI